MLHQKKEWCQLLIYITIGMHLNHAGQLVQSLCIILTILTTHKLAPTSYLTMVRPKLEYASVVHMGSNDIQKLENIQRRAARWVLEYYGRYSPCSNISPGLNFRLDTRYLDCRYFIKHSTIIFYYLYLPTIFL